jgi:hypothetical protein
VGRRLDRDERARGDIRPTEVHDGVVDVETVLLADEHRGRDGDHVAVDGRVAAARDRRDPHEAAGVRRVADRIPDQGDIGRAGIARFGHSSGLLCGERRP